MFLARAGETDSAEPLNGLIPVNLLNFVDQFWAQYLMQVKKKEKKNLKEICPLEYKYPDLHQQGCGCSFRTITVYFLRLQLGRAKSTSTLVCTHDTFVHLRVGASTHISGLPPTPNPCPPRLPFLPRQAGRCNPLEAVALLLLLLLGGLREPQWKHGG